MRRGWFDWRPVVIALITVALSGLAVSAPQLPTEDPVTVVARLQDGIVDLDTRLAAADYQARFDGFAPLIESTHDLDYMARITLSRGWRSLDDAQRRKFLDAFRELSIASYATRFRDMAGAEFERVDQRELSGGRVEVQTQLSAPEEEPVTIHYVLHDSGAGWRVINVLAEGVSDLALKRAQYQQILKESGFQALLAHLGEQLAQARQE